jgi:hypothetical protein
MRAVLAAVIFVGVSPGFAAEPSQADALYRLSGKYAVCAAYYTVGVTCLRNESVRADYLEAQHKATIFGYAAGAKAGVSVEGLYFESENAMDSMKAIIKSDCDNIAIAVERYAEPCEALMKDAKERSVLSTEGTVIPREQLN